MLKKICEFNFKNLEILLKNNTIVHKQLYVTSKCPEYEEDLMVKRKSLHYPISWGSALPYEKIPGPLTDPIFGIMHHYFPGGKYFNLNLKEIHMKMRYQYGDLVLMRALPGHRDLVIAFDPDEVEYVFHTEGICPARRCMETFEYFCKNIRPDIFGNTTSLLTGDGRSWQYARTKINLIMPKSKILRTYISSLDEISCDFIERLKLICNNHHEVARDFLNELNKFSLETIGNIAVNTRFGLLHGKTTKAHLFIQCIQDFWNLTYDLDVLPSIWKILITPKFVKMMKTLDIMTNLLIQYIDKSIKKIEHDKLNGVNNPKDEISVFEKLHKIDRNLAISMGLDLLLGGVVTITSAIASILYLLAKNPNKQEILRKEIIQAFPNKNEKLKSFSMKNLPYLRAVLKEALRIKPVVLANLRTTGQDVVLNGYRIPKGTDILMPTVLSNDEKYFDNPEEFVPERWLSSKYDKNKKKMHPCIYLPFGYGPRSCIGKRFAELQIEILIVRIVSNFKINWNYPELTYTSKVLSVPKGDFKLELIDV